MNRRDFLVTSGVPALASALACKAEAAAPQARGEWRNRQPGMSYRRLGRTGFMVSEIVMGGNRVSPDNCEHILLALDTGLNYLDTAPAYGRGASERGHAKIVQARKRDAFFLNTKVSLWDGNRTRLYRDIFDSLAAPEQARLRARVKEEIGRRGAAEPDYLGGYFRGQLEALEAAVLSNVMAESYGHKIDRRKHYKQLVLDSVEESLQRLGTDYLDVMTCPHGACTPYELLNHSEIFEAFEILRKQGKARHLSVSAHTDPAGILEAAMQTKVYSMAMVAYNIVNHRFVRQALEKARREDFGVIAMKVARPVYNGRGDGTADDPSRVRLIQDAVPGPLKVPQKAYVWALRNPNLGAVISEMLNADMVKDNLPLAAPKPAA